MQQKRGIIIAKTHCFLNAYTRIGNEHDTREIKMVLEFLKPLPMVSRVKETFFFFKAETKCMAFVHEIIFLTQVHNCMSTLRMQKE